MTPEEALLVVEAFQPGHPAAPASAQVHAALGVLAAETRRLLMARRVSAEQARDEGLWFNARTAPEGALQAALRRLAWAVEGDAR